MARSDAPFRDLTGAYALDALTDDELAGFLAYLGSDEDARAESTELLDTAALLGAAVAPVPAPPGLRTRLLACTEVLEPAAVQRPPVERPAVDSPAAMHPASARPVVSLTARLRRRWIPALGAAAAVALIAGVAGTALTSAPSGADRLLAAADVHTVRSHADGGGTAEVLWSPSERRAAVNLHGLPELGGQRVYELWFIDDVGLATRAGLVRSGDTASAVLLDGRFHRGDAIGITIEPRGGSSAPTTVPIVEVDTA